MIKLRYAGKLYEGDYVKLMEQLDNLYEQYLAPGDLPTRRQQDQKINGVIVPHDNYELAGSCATWAYKKIAEATFPRRYIFLLPDDTGTTLNYLTTLQDFESVFGVCKVDKEFVQKLLETGIVSQAEDFISGALELQLPLLQHVSKDKIREVTIVPIIVPHTNNLSALVEAIDTIDDNSVLIVVSNFTKYGPKYLFTPYKYNIEQSQKDLDATMAKLITNFDSEGLQKFVQRNKLQVSGICSLVTGLELLKKKKIKDVMLLSYYRSNIINGDPENYVSYMSFSF